MKILYGVQGTGNGHITRAREMARALQDQGITTEFVFSGRPSDHYFDMEPFGNYRCFKGLTFATDHGRINHWQTIKTNSLRQFFRDCRQLDLSTYDLVVTDFEPISAWAARSQGIRSIGIGHQYAFHHNIPRAEDNLLTTWLMRQFAPADIPVGLHWHHFNQPILPPIIDTQHQGSPIIDDKILV